MSAEQTQTSHNPGSMPTLYNPANVTALSLLLSPAFGAWLTARNQTALGQLSAARISQLWAVVSGAALIAAMVFGGRYAGAVGFWLLVAWYLLSGRPHVRYVNQHLGNAYNQRPLWKPIALGIAGVLALAAMTATITFRDNHQVEPDTGLARSAYEQPKADAAPFTVTGVIDAGTAMANVTTTDGQTYSFATDTDMANVVFASCQIGDTCEITGTVSQDQLSSIHSARRVGPLTH